MIGGRSVPSFLPLFRISVSFGYGSNYRRSHGNEGGPAGNGHPAELPGGRGDGGLFAPRSKSLHHLGSESCRRLLGLPRRLVGGMGRICPRSRHLLRIVSYRVALCSGAASAARGAGGVGSVVER